jgi:hypothetical protein
MLAKIAAISGISLVVPKIMVILFNNVVSGVAMTD